MAIEEICCDTFEQHMGGSGLASDANANLRKKTILLTISERVNSAQREKDRKKIRQELFFFNE